MLASRHLARCSLRGLPRNLVLHSKPATTLSKRKLQEIHVRNWFSAPDVKGEKAGTASYGPTILVTFGIIGIGVALWQYEKKRSRERMLEYNAQVVLKCEECQCEIPPKSKVVTEGIERWAFCPRCKKMNFVFEQQRVPQCHECDVHITGTYSSNMRNDVYCKKHTKMPHQSCFYCSRYIYLDKPPKPSNRVKLYSCDECKHTRMKRDAIPNALSHVKQELKEGYGIDFGENVSYSIKMVKRMPTDMQFTSTSTGGHRSLVGRTTTRITNLLNPFKSHGWSGDIIILEGFDQIGFEKVLAHEIGHVYIRSNKIKFPPDIEEGLCNLLSYLYMRQLCKQADTPQPKLRFYMRQMEKDPDDIYGEGFRKVFNMYFNVRNKSNAEIKFSEFLDILHANYGTRINSFSYPTTRSPPKTAVPQ